MRRPRRATQVQVGQRVGVFWSAMQGIGETNRWRYGVVVWAFKNAGTVRVKLDNDFPDTERNVNWKDVFPEDVAKKMEDEEKCAEVMKTLEKKANG